MELRQYLKVLGRRKWVVLAVTAITVIAVAIGSLLMTPVYSASTTIRVVQAQDPFTDRYSLDYMARLMNTYVELVRRRPFLEETIQRLGLNISPGALAKNIAGESIPNTELLRITAKSESPELATIIANTLGELLVEEGEELYSGGGKSAEEILFEQLTAVEANLVRDREQLQVLLGEAGEGEQSAEIRDLNSRIGIQDELYRTVLDAYENARLSATARANSIRIVEPAEVPSNPSEPKIARNLALGLVVGLAGGVGLAFLLQNLDLAIYSPTDLEKEDRAAFLGTIPNIKVPSRLRHAPFLLAMNGKSAADEAFNMLGSSILSMDYGKPPRTLLITSVEERAGKSTILSNLSVALAHTARKVVAVDCDLRDPSLDRVFGVSNDLGLKRAIVRGGGPETSILETRTPGVNVLPSGPAVHNPAELLALPSTKLIIGDLANWADMVLFDSPPVSRFADAFLLAPLVDAVIIVLERGKTSTNQVKKAVDQLTKLGVEQIGIVINRTE